MPLPTTVTVVVAHETLPERLRPCFVDRGDNITVIFVDPICPRSDAIRWSIENLTIAERSYIRAAHGQPPIGQPIDEALMDSPDCWYIPPLLRAPRVDRVLAEGA